VSYYDNVKENVKKESSNGGGSGNSGKSKDSSKSPEAANFDTLREAASETDPEEEGGDDTPIEVLEEDGISRESPKTQQKQQSRSEKSSGQKQRNRGSSGSSSEVHGAKSSGKIESGGSGSGNPLKNSGSSASTVDADFSAIEEKLDTIIEQNREMVEILRSFAE
jgi:hypothetical protein